MTAVLLRAGGGTRRQAMFVVSGNLQRCSREVNSASESRKAADVLTQRWRSAGGIDLDCKSYPLIHSSDIRLEHSSAEIPFREISPTAI